MSLIPPTSNASALAAIGWKAGLAAAHGTSRVSLAVLDWGFDILHPTLVGPSGQSRIKTLIDQNTGLRLDGAAIDRLRALCGAKRSRGPADDAYDPHANYYDRSGAAWGAHGTAMASIAAGTPAGAFTGVAPASDIIAIQLAHVDPHWKEVDGDGRPTWLDGEIPAAAWNGWRSYLDSPALVGALETAWGLAQERGDDALVILLAAGAWAGAHDGRSPVEQTISDITSRWSRGSGPVTTVVLTTGNAAGLSGHFHAVLQEETRVITWRMGPDDPTPNKLEVWYRSEQPLDARLAAPGHADGAPLPAGTTTVVTLDGQRVGIADHVPAASPPLSRLRIVLHPPCFPALAMEADGRMNWRLMLQASTRAPVAVHAWLDRDDGEIECSTLSPACRDGTLSGIACADGAFVVGCYDHQSDDMPDRFSGLGPRPWVSGRAAEVPHAIAPGHRITAARSKTTGFVPTWGTSPAASLAAGAVCLVSDHAVASAGPDVSARRAAAARAAAMLARGRDEPWTPARGAGPIDVSKTIEEVTR